MAKSISFYELSALNKKNNKGLVEKLQLKNEFKVIFFRKGQIISNYLKKNNVFFIIEGHVLRSFLDIDGNNKSLDILSNEEFLGIASLENGVPATSELSALTKVKVLEIPEYVFLKYPVYTLPVLYSNYQYTFCVLYLNWRASLALGNERVNTALISIAYYLGENTINNIYKLPNFITHQIIADFSSVSRSYVTRCISTLKELGIIKISKKSIIINNIEDLKRISPSYQPF